MVLNYGAIGGVFWLFHVAWLAWAIYAVVLSDWRPFRTIVGRPALASSPNVVPMRPRTTETRPSAVRGEDRAA